MNLEAFLTNHPRFAAYETKKQHVAHFMYAPVDDHGYGVILPQHFSLEELQGFLQRYKEHDAFASVVCPHPRNDVLPFHVVDGKSIQNVWYKDVLHTAVSGYETLVPIDLDILLNREKHNELIRTFYK